jgi:hypothetical protein
VHTQLQSVSLSKSLPESHGSIQFPPHSTVPDRQSHPQVFGFSSLSGGQSVTHPPPQKVVPLEQDSHAPSTQICELRAQFSTP